MVVAPVQYALEEQERFMRYVVAEVPYFAPLRVEIRDLDFESLNTLLIRERDHVPLRLNAILDAMQDELNDALNAQERAAFRILGIYLIAHRV